MFLRTLLRILPLNSSCSQQLASELFAGSGYFLLPGGGRELAEGYGWRSGAGTQAWPAGVAFKSVEAASRLMHTFFEI